MPFLTDAKSDPFVKFHIKQGLVLIIFEIITWFIEIIPVIGYLIGWIFWLVTIIFIIVGVMNASQKKEQELPLIGGYAKNFNF